MTKPENSDLPTLFEGRLTAENAEMGIRSLQENAARLARDARLLYHGKRYPGAAMLAAMALDEVGKIPAVMELALAEPDQLQAGWKKFRQPKRDFPWSIFVRGRPQMSDEDTNRMLALVAAIGRSVECLGAGTWTDPRQLVPEALAKELVATAEMICTNAIDRRGIEIWLRLARSAKPNASPQHMLAQYRSALQAEGLIEEAAMVAELGDNRHATRLRPSSGR